MRCTPSSFRAQTLARLGTMCGGNWCLTPCRGTNATERSPTFPMVIGPLGSPYGVDGSTVRTSSRNE